MPFNGNGVFTRLYSWANDAAASINILASRMDNETNGIASGLTNCITRDGQSPATADIPMGGHKLTGLADPTQESDAATKAYADNAAVTELANATGSSLVGFEQAGTGAVPSTVQAKLRQQVSVFDFGAVADGVWNGTAASGTDNYPAFLLALTFCAGVGRALYIPAGVYYLSRGIVLPSGVMIEGDGYVGLGTFIDNGTRTGTILLVSTAAGADSIKWTENSHGGSIRNLTVFDVNGAVTPKSIINITGVLHPRMEHVEFCSLVHANCPGLLLDGSTTGALSETLYGVFINLYCTQSVGTPTAAVAIGLKIVGRSTSPSKRANDNHFFGGDIAGYVRPLEISALVAGAGAFGCSFHGTTFEGTYTVNGSTPYMTIDYVVDGTTVLGSNTNGPVYSVRLVSITDARQISFHGCYFELGGSPATYNDGTHGVLTLFPTIWLDNSSTVKATTFFGSSWNNAYIYDNGVFTDVDQTTDFKRYSTASVTGLKVNTTAATTITGSFVKVPFTLQQGDAYLTWDAVANEGTVHSDGWYCFHAILGINGFIAATASGQLRLVAGGFTEAGSRSPGTGATCTPDITAYLPLNRGDKFHIEAAQNSGTNQTLSTDSKENRLAVIKIA